MTCSRYNISMQSIFILSSLPFLQFFNPLFLYRLFSLRILNSAIYTEFKYPSNFEFRADLYFPPGI